CGTADVTTRARIPAMCAGSCPAATGTPRRTRSGAPAGLASQPVTRAPRRTRSSASALMPAPAAPMKWTGRGSERSMRGIDGRQSSDTRPGGSSAEICPGARRPRRPRALVATRACRPNRFVLTLLGQPPEVPMTLSRRFRTIRSLSTLGVVFTLAACGGPSPTAPTAIRQLPRALTADEQQLITQSNGFAFSLLQQVSSLAPDSNLFMSPLSASMALGMTMNGAEGSTLDAMRSTLGFSSMSLAQADASYESLIALLRGLDPNVTFQIANSIWYRQGFAVEPDFLQTDKQYFDATVQG